MYELLLNCFENSSAMLFLTFHLLIPYPRHGMPCNLFLCDADVVASCDLEIAAGAPNVPQRGIMDPRGMGAASRMCRAMCRARVRMVHSSSLTYVGLFRVSQVWRCKWNIVKLREGYVTDVRSHSCVRITAIPASLASATDGLARAVKIGEER